MIGFLPLKGDRLLPLHRIKLIGREQHLEGRVLPTREIHITDAASLEADAFDVDLMLKRPVQLMPAEPGVRLLYFDVNDPKDLFVGRTPLIAWALCLDGEIRPVTPAGVDDGSVEPEAGWYVEMPDKRVFCTNDFTGPSSFEKAEEALQYFGKQRHAESGGAA